MKQFLVICAFSLLTLPHALRAQMAPDSAIEAVISNQFDAFLDEDVDKAWTYASPTIQGMFRTPENFGNMVENGYPMVWAPTSTEFLELREEAGGLWQRVQVGDMSGTVHLLDYKMVEIDGSWRIDAVVYLESVGVGV
ncbi:DUF4864 domain-containing protein [Maritimibacter sp. DP1N21-5]|uniref:DUF4864 domain-containing protein n=1 Tax=Maritimibacter sp. DP1N21-5 TaxID=2836867 RepID=UPI001C453B34|nr:DUF4864 domain-containing protein [Maritimibacter sp. DP1N21-5]MBV7410309.1 DUF4864 domain-containing protein [Maritimibacter sp. DP1N21-5]